MSHNSPEGNRSRARTHYVAKLAHIKKWKSTGCAHCGELDTIVLEADHIDETTKSPYLKKPGGRSRHLSELSWADLKAELGLCQVLCANCHRRKTYARKYWKAGPAGGLL